MASDFRLKEKEFAKELMKGMKFLIADFLLLYHVSNYSSYLFDFISLHISYQFQFFFHY